MTTAIPVTKAIEHNRLGALTKISQGGQGAVYRAPSVATTFAPAMVYKEYKPQILAGLDTAALSAMPNFLESLPYVDGEKLISTSAWPCATVENNSTTTGFVMPEIPAEFFIPLTTVKGTSSVEAQFQHLLNEQQVLDQRGLNITNVQRYELLHEVASALEFLHRNAVCVGDISPKNLLFSLAPRPAVYFIDCDAMRVKGVSVMPQLETPGWEVPGTGEELATPYSDTYKLGLLALRILVGDQDVKDIGWLPQSAPPIVRQAIEETLTRPPQRRPPLSAWTYTLDRAIDEAKRQPAQAPSSPKTAPTATVSAPNRTVVQPTVITPPPPIPPPYPTSTPPAKTASKASKKGWWTAAAAAVLLLLFVVPTIISSLSNSGGSTSSSSSTPSYPPTTSARSDSPATTAPPATVTVPPAPPTQTRPPAPPAPSVPPTAGLPQLRAQANIDSADVTAWAKNQWFPQLSSKQPGTLDDGIRYDHDSIWAEHLQLRQQYDARLLWSGDWPNTFKKPDYWVTIAWYAFPDADGAREWCQNHGRDSDHCYPTRIQ